MPQDIPLDASEKLVFTPESLKNIEGAPSFTLRAVTPRDRRFHQRRFLEEGVSLHNAAAIRREILVGLSGLWSEEDAAKFNPLIQSYWDARDDFELQRKDEPDLVFEFDKEIGKAVDELVEKVTASWPRLRTMAADNIDFQDMAPVVLVSVVAEGWSGIEVRREIDRGYLTTKCAEDVKKALGRFEEKHAKLYDLTPGNAWNELFVACASRLVLDDEEMGNSESPSPSDTTPPPSAATVTSAKVGKSRKSASSSKTPATA